MACWHYYPFFGKTGMLRYLTGISGGTPILRDNQAKSGMVGRYDVHVQCMYTYKSSSKYEKKEGANPGQLFQAFGPNHKGAAQFLPGTAGLK